MATAPDGAVHPVCFTYRLSVLRNRNKSFCGSGPASRLFRVPALKGAAASHWQSAFERARLCAGESNGAMNQPPIYYFDNNATTRVAPEVVDAMIPFLREQWGNPSSTYVFGRQVGEHVDQARARVAALINAEPQGDHLHELRHGEQQLGDPQRPGHPAGETARADHRRRALGEHSSSATSSRSGATR